MALESVSVAETVIQSNDDNDLEDGEIPSDEDDEPVKVPEEIHRPEPPKPPPEKIEPVKKTFDNKFIKNKSETGDKAARTKNVASDDWAGDVEKAIRAALDDDRGKSEPKPKNKNNKNKNRKRNLHDREEDRIKDSKRKKREDDDINNEDDDEMLFVRGASPSRKNSLEKDITSPKRDHDNYHSGSDFDDRAGPNRHREDKRSSRWAAKQERNKKISPIANRRNAKNDRASKKSSARQLRNERNARRNQGNDHNQDPDAICVYYMQGKCHRGEECPYSHDALPPRKMELCKFYLMDCCAKRDKCLYMHHDFPCKFFHTGSQCSAGDNCKFSHDPMNEQVKNILLKHLETAPKEILGNFPRLSREGALSLINNTEKSIAQGQSVPNSKIPSLFELKVPTPIVSNLTCEPVKEENDMKNEENLTVRERERKDRKKTRWGSNEDRVPMDVVMQLGFTPDQEKSQLSVNFYGEGGPNDVKPETEEPVKKLDTAQDNILKELQKSADFRQLIAKAKAVVNVAEEAAHLTHKSADDESDRDEDQSLFIEMPTEDEDKSIKKPLDAPNDFDKISNKNKVPDPLSSQEIPANLPKKTQELYMRIQQQQREAEDSHKILENNENQEINQDDWYSDDGSDDDDDDDNQLTIVQDDVPKEEEKEEKEEEEEKDDEPLQPSLIPQPATITDTLGALSKIDISAEVSTLLSSLKARTANSLKQEKESTSKAKKDPILNEFHDASKPSIPDFISQYSKMETSDTSPGMSPNLLSGSVASQPTSSSRDPRMSRDPRQRREEQRQSSVSSNSSSNSIPPSSRTNEASKDSRLLKPEMSIYSSGIIATDSDVGYTQGMKPDQDHRRKDMDLRCFPQGSNFGDTDLRFTGGNYTDAAKSGDVDLRQMLSLGFKPVPSHVPCTEIEASISSHPPIPYKIVTIDIPRPNYTGLKLTKNDPQVRYDPRLRKIFRLSKDDIADSPMSPPPMKMLDTPKSPPLVRSDPRRKALEAQPPKIIPTTVQQHLIQDHTNLAGMPMNMAAGYMQGGGNMQGNMSMNMHGPNNMQGPNSMQGPNNMQGPNSMQGPGNMQCQGGMQGTGMMSNMNHNPQPLMMQNNMSSGMGGPQPLMMNNSMMRDANMMGNNSASMSQDNARMRNMGPPSQNHMQQSLQGPSQHQMNQYDPRYSSQRGNTIGLLGAAPQNMGGYPQDMRGQYDGPPSRGFQDDDYGNYGKQGRGDPRSMYNHNGQMDGPNYPKNKSDWGMNPGRPNRKERRRPGRGKFGGMSRKKDLS